MQPPPLINLSGLSDDASTRVLASPPGRRRRWWWIGIIIGTVLVLLLGGFILSAVARRGSSVTYQYGHVTRGNLVIGENATGPLQSGNYNLVFSGAGGKIDEIDVSVGDRVTKGQVLAQLDKTLLQDAVNQAQVAVGNAQAGLDAALASSDSSVVQSNANVSAAQTGLSDAETNLTQTQNQGAANVAAAETTLKNAKTNLTHVTDVANAQKLSASDTYDATNCNGSTPTPKPTPKPTSTVTPMPTSTTNCTEALDTFNTAVDQANANIATAQAQVNAAQAALTQAQAAAATNNTTALNQINTADSQLNTALAGAGVSQTTEQGQVTTAQSQLNTTVVQLVQAEDNLNNATLKAPHDGIVTQINGTVGGTPGGGGGSASSAITSGASTSGGSSLGLATGATFIQIVDPLTLQVVANVNEADIANVQVGETAQFTVNAYGNQQFTGAVSAVPPLGQTISNVVTYPVTIDVDSSSLKGAHLLPGMTANVMIDAVQHNNVLLLPVNAVNFARLASSGNSASNTPQLISTTVATTTLNQARRMLGKLEVSNPDLISEGPIPTFVIEKSGQQFVAKPVVLGLTDGTSYEILQGLSLSDTFVVGTNR